LAAVLAAYPCGGKAVFLGESGHRGARSGGGSRKYIANHAKHLANIAATAAADPSIYEFSTRHSIFVPSWRKSPTIRSIDSSKVA
jgi:hypothetical protein